MRDGAGAVDVVSAVEVDVAVPPATVLAAVAELVEVTDIVTVLLAVTVAVAAAGTFVAALLTNPEGPTSPDTARTDVEPAKMRRIVKIPRKPINE